MTVETEGRRGGPLCVAPGIVAYPPGQRARVAVLSAARLATIAAVIAAAAAASDTASGQSAQPAVPPRDSRTPGTASTTLPPVVIDSPHLKRVRSAGRRRAAPAAAVRNTEARPKIPVLPDGAVLRGGPPVTQTTAGPVSGYRALTSTSATKTDTPIERIPQAIAVIPRAVIDDQQPLTQSEAFRNISGVTGMPANTFIGFAYKVRGFPADRYVDGLPNYYDGGDNTSLVNTERIEVLKGPAGILYQAGLGPVGGIINSVSKLPTTSRFTEIGVTAGGYRLWNPWFDVNQPLNSAGTALLRVTGDFEKSHDFIDVIEHRRYSIDPTLLLNDNDGTRLTIQGRFSSRASQSYSGLPGAGTVDRSLFTIRPSLFPEPPDLPNSTTTTNGVTVRLDREFNDVWSINASTRVSEFRLRQTGQFLPSDAPLFGSTFGFLNFNLPIDTRELASNVNLVAKSTIGPAQNTLLLGADYDVVTDRSRIDLGPAGLVDLANPVFPPYTIPTTNAYNADNKYQNSGLTAQLQSTLYERLHLLAGVRLAHVQIRSIDSASQSDFVTDAWKPLPRLGAVVDLVAGVSAFADYSQGYRGVPFFNAGTAPKPEEAEQTEAGLKLVLPSGFTSTLAVFTITRRNVANLLPGTPFVGTQVGEQRSQGFDADLTWQPLPGLSLIGSYAHINAYVLKDQLFAVGNLIERVPRDSGRLWANYKFQDGPLRNISIGAGLYAASRQAVALDNLYFTPGFVTFDGKIAYETDHWSLGVTGKNLADRRYFQPFPAGGGFVAPAESRTVYAFARLKY